jgi:L-rhamnose isomerase
MEPQEKARVFQAIETIRIQILLLQDAFNTDVWPANREWRGSKGLSPDPMKAFQESGYLERLT